MRSHPDTKADDRVPIVTIQCEPDFRCKWDRHDCQSAHRAGILVRGCNKHRFRCQKPESRYLFSYGPAYAEMNYCNNLINLASHRCNCDNKRSQT
jgi:hypothetical protein